VYNKGCTKKCNRKFGRSLRAGLSVPSPHFAALRSGLSTSIPNAGSRTAGVLKKTEQVKQHAEARLITER